MDAKLAYRSPTVEEFSSVTAAVGFKPHHAEAIRIGLANSWCSVCAIAGKQVVGVGRVVGDGALHFYITGIMVIPSHQRKGIGTRIVEALLSKVQEIRYPNTLVEAMPVPGLEAFYSRFGFKASRQHAPGMHLWLNADGASSRLLRD
jgi:GNAT superfamily N-acetyltransferase